MRYPEIMKRFVLPVLFGAALLAGAGPANAQDTELRAERVVPFVTGKITPLNAKVGPVHVISVEFSDRGRAAGGGLPGLRQTPSEMSTTLRAHFLAENPSRDEWEVTFTLEFLDKAGKIIDRVTKKETWEGQSKPYDLDHPILSYVVPAIAEVRIRLEGRLD
jgi:hypothetical protein